MESVGQVTENVGSASAARDPARQHLVCRRDYKVQIRQPCASRWITPFINPHQQRRQVHRVGHLQQRRSDHLQYEGSQCEARERLKVADVNACCLNN
jgi:hypothetical protein